ncbi:penicillin acylase family protein [Rhodobacteraceae bacterium WD3A24]|nr:penicillin acylase family protein [Rhodobacteraceae bacterium WD3A24]
MITAFRWLLRLFFGLALLIAVVSVLGYYFLSRSLPDYDADFTVEGINGGIEILRNSDNVPHIFAEADEDVFFGLGFAHAQDRLWQMTLLRRTAQGRLSEVFGARTLETDEMMRRLDLYGLASESVEAQDAETRAALEAYARGVNAWVRQVNEGALGRGAPEFFVFSNEIAFWQPADSLAVLKLLAVQLSGQLENEVLRARLALLTDDDRHRDLMPVDDGPGIAALPDFAALFPELRPDDTPLRTAGGSFSPFARRGFEGASNAWAATPERAAAGGALLANDPHLEFSAPVMWYLARLELSTGGVIGATIPGIPAVLAGRSEDLGWGLTSSYLDDQDLFIERLDPENPERYLTPDGWAEFETRRSIIRVADGAPRTYTLRWSENGPVLPGRHMDVGSVTPPGHVATLAWTVLDGQDTTMTAILRMMQARGIEAALEAGELYVAPSQNIVLSDGERIAMQMVGAAPRRDADHETRGRMPSPGWRERNRWQGMLPYSSNPRFLDPESGILGNTNNKPLDRPFPLHVSYDWGDTHRIRRWTRLMSAREVHTRDSFIEAQLDTVSPAARALLPLIAADLWYSGEPAPAGTPERLRQRALDLLAEWNGEMNEHLPEPLIYAAWMRHLQQRLIRDELGPLAGEFAQVSPAFLERVFRDTDGAAAWCNVVQSAADETCTEIARDALDAALLWLSERFGGDPESWRWGDLHQAAHDHTVLGQVPMLRYAVNIRQSTSGGDTTLMRGLTRGRGENPFLNIHGAGYRGVYDFADPDSSVFITSTGQSGHPLSRHYDDLGERWRRGEYIPMSLDPDLARAGAVGVTRLTPAAAPPRQ